VVIQWDRCKIILAVRFSHGDDHLSISLLPLSFPLYLVFPKYVLYPSSLSFSAAASTLFFLFFSPPFSPNPQLTGITKKQKVVLVVLAFDNKLKGLLYMLYVCVQSTLVHVSMFLHPYQLASAPPASP
jgi:hypothetical protein